MEKLKQFQWLIIAVLVFSAFGTAFYRFSLRPTYIRKECWNKIEKIKSGETKSSTFVSEEFDIALGNQKAIDAFYSNCLKEGGLKK